MRNSASENVYTVALDISYVSDVKVRNVNIENFDVGIRLVGSRNIEIGHTLQYTQPRHTIHKKRTPHSLGTARF